MADIARITEVIEPEVKALGFDLVRVRLFGKSEVGDEEHTLQIMAERPETGQLVMQDCVVLSHRISDKIDELEAAGETLIHEAYRLEVSSPGIDRPLMRLKDYATWVGHEARITLLVPVDGNRKSIQGELVAVEGDVIVLDEKKSGRVSFPFRDVQYAKLVFTDKLLAATKPIDSDDADEFDAIDDDTELDQTGAQED
jgi:ribosome maturation factor RimP